MRWETKSRKEKKNIKTNKTKTKQNKTLIKSNENKEDF